ncbi:MAG: hypothetical protein ACT6QM_05950 [Brevundimonas mediterranea]|uniref:hypothetical protein n=1 Tax=Brevundimonas mediterranea TaxID=74329 RepID=UPI0040349A94
MSGAKFGLVVNAQGMITGYQNQTPGHGSFTLQAWQVRFINQVYGGKTLTEFLGDKRSKDSAAPWWKRITG